MGKLRIVFASAVAVLAVSVCAAQGDKKKDEPVRPDLSGEWVLHRARSYSTEYAVRLTVVHREPEIRVKRILTGGESEQTEECTYYTDGRKEKKEDIGCRDSESLTARWSGRKLVRRSRSTTKGVMKIDMVMTEEWELSADGKTLTRTVTHSQVPTPQQTILPRVQTKYVFTRGS